MNRNLYAIIPLFIVLLQGNIYAQNHEVFKHDSLIITSNVFYSKVDSRIDFLLRKDTMAIEDAIEMIRISNTLSCNRYLQGSDISIKYNNLFMGNYSENAVHLIQGYPSTGYGYYSKKYDLHFGGVKRFHINSHYVLIDKL